VDSIEVDLLSDDGIDRRGFLKCMAFNFTFTGRGTYPYNCSIHPKMQGKVIVT
jgi:plastocyanin